MFIKGHRSKYKMYTHAHAWRIFECFPLLDHSFREHWRSETCRTPFWGFWGIKPVHFISLILELKPQIQSKSKQVMQKVNHKAGQRNSRTRKNGLYLYNNTSTHFRVCDFQVCCWTPQFPKNCTRKNGFHSTLPPPIFSCANFIPVEHLYQIMK